jgi:hypothetical protein
MFPALRLAYIIVPENLTEPVAAAMDVAGADSPTLSQMVLAEFIEDGHFVRHLRRMRQLYSERQAVLVESASRELGGLLEMQRHDSGMRLVGWLPAKDDDSDASRLASGGNRSSTAERLLHEGEDPTGVAAWVRGHSSPRNPHRCATPACCPESAQALVDGAPRAMPCQPSWFCVSDVRARNVGIQTFDRPIAPSIITGARTPGTHGHYNFDGGGRVLSSTFHHKTKR